MFDERVKSIRNILKIKKSSFDACKLFADNSLEFVYLDASHKFEHVVEDSTVWLPKIKNGFYIGGHDYNNIEDNHVEVKPAIDSIFNENNIITFIDTSWVFKVLR